MHDLKFLASAFCFIILLLIFFGGCATTHFEDGTRAALETTDRSQM